jgi:hypothetical protein
MLPQGSPLQRLDLGSHRYREWVRIEDWWIFN